MPAVNVNVKLFTPKKLKLLFYWSRKKETASVIKPDKSPLTLEEELCYSWMEVDLTMAEEVID